MKTIGVDIAEIERVAACIDRFGDRFLRRVYTGQELAYCQGRVSSLAVRWAAKEAVAKALGTGIGDVRWTDIEIVNDENCRPSIRLHGQAAVLAQQLGIRRFAVSLSHAREYAVAFVVGE
ncbi:MAG: holo-[acyl-carrier-protein] synthase [Chloroflexi bacterium]|nr:MAG: holo-[acyl-carrier-protein] synthase [Chloroflexota bacterium]